MKFVVRLFRVSFLMPREQLQLGVPVTPFRKCLKMYQSRILFSCISSQETVSSAKIMVSDFAGVYHIL